RASLRPRLIGELMTTASPAGASVPFGTPGTPGASGPAGASVPPGPATRDATGEPRFTPLRGIHEVLGATFTDFGGWQMPVRYGSDLAEHRAVREAAGIFDISHMAEFLVTGDGAGVFLDYALAGTLSTLAVGRAKYSLLLAD